MEGNKLYTNRAFRRREPPTLPSQHCAASRNLSTASAATRLGVMCCQLTLTAYRYAQSTDEQVGMLFQNSKMPACVTGATRKRWCAYRMGHVITWRPLPHLQSARRARTITGRNNLPCRILPCPSRSPVGPHEINTSTLTSLLHPASSPLSFQALSTSISSTFSSLALSLTQSLEIGLPKIIIMSC